MCGVWILPVLLNVCECVDIDSNSSVNACE
uniref:Uncharacterized protein n=1 Tax=Anguilla anguilla TaxID=7936 RepID=A0A0E9VI68_ANGAN